MRRCWLGWGVATLAAFVFALTIWPTQYRTLKLGPLVLREHRLTGRIERLTESGWADYRDTLARKAPIAPQSLPGEALSALTGKGSFGETTYRVNLYNGSSWTLRNLTIDLKQQPLDAPPMTGPLSGVEALAVRERARQEGGAAEAAVTELLDDAVRRGLAPGSKDIGGSSPAAAALAAVTDSDLLLFIRGSTDKVTYAGLYQLRRWTAARRAQGATTADDALLKYKALQTEIDDEEKELRELWANKEGYTTDQALRVVELNRHTKEDLASIAPKPSRLETRRFQLSPEHDARPFQNTTFTVTGDPTIGTFVSWRIVDAEGFDTPSASDRAVDEFIAKVRLSADEIARYQELRARPNLTLSELREFSRLDDKAKTVTAAPK